MGTVTVWMVLMVVPIALNVAMLLWAPEKWLQGFVLLARSFVRMM